MFRSVRLFLFSKSVKENGLDRLFHCKHGKLVILDKHN